MAAPAPLSGLLPPGVPKTFTGVSLRQMEESVELRHAIEGGALGCETFPDDTVPDQLEQASVHEQRQASGTIVWDETTTWGEVWRRVADAGYSALVLVVGTADGSPLPLTPMDDGSPYDLSGVYFLGVPGTSGTASVAFQQDVVVAVGALLRSKDVFWTWDPEMTTPIPAFSMSIELDGGAITAPVGAVSYLFATSNWATNRVKMVNGAVIDGSALTAPLAVFDANFAGIIPPQPLGPSYPSPRPWPPGPLPPRPPHHGIDFTLLESKLLGSVVNTPSDSTSNTVTADADSTFALAVNFSGGASVSVTLLYPPRMTTADRTAYAPPAGAVVYDTDVDAPFVMTVGGWRQLALV
jgi:hypothetical protein